MTKIDKAIDLAFKAHLAEYDRMVKEIAIGLEWHKSLVQYSLFFTGTSITAISFFPETRELYLIASIVLSAIGWAFTEQSYKMLLFGRYISLQLKPKVDSLVKRVGGKAILRDTAFELLNFDDYFRQGDIRTFLAGVPAIGKFAVAVLLGLLFALAYKMNAGTMFSSWSLYEKVVFSVAIVIGIAPIVSGLSTLPLFVKHK